jgi:hypothetical protein
MELVRQNYLLHDIEYQNCQSGTPGGEGGQGS